MKNSSNRHRSRTPLGRRGLAAVVALVLSMIATSVRVPTADGTSSVSPLSIGVRSAVARGAFGYGVSSNSSSRRRPAPWVAKGDGALPERREGESITRIGRGGAATTTRSLSTNKSLSNRVDRGGSAAAMAIDRRLHFWEAMVCGAVSRSAAQTIMHPANAAKTILQCSRSAPGEAPLTIRSFARWEHAKQLTRGAGAQLLLSLPLGAVNFAVLELVRRKMNDVVSRSRYADRIDRHFGPGMDFLSSALSTVCCSVVSTPQSMICDNIMAGTYPNLVAATSNLMKDKGISGFYTGWWPGIAGKIPSYGLTWALYEQIKRARSAVCYRPAKDIENFVMGCVASTASCCIMMPFDTVKTRLVTQMNCQDLIPYNGLNDCFRRILREEGAGALYRGLAPRLVSVVPMIGIQFGFYELMKRALQEKGQLSAKKHGDSQTTTVSDVR